MSRHRKHFNQLATQEVRRRFGDQRSCQSARAQWSVTREVHQLILRSSAGEDLGISLRRPFHDHLFRAADAGHVLGERRTFDHDAQSLEAIVEPVMRFKAYVPADARTATGLGREREGSAILIDSSGLMLTVPEALEINQSLLVTLSSVDTPFNLSLRARVMHQTLVGHGDFTMYRIEITLHSLPDSLNRGLRAHRMKYQRKNLHKEHPSRNVDIEEDTLD
jgi:hypothetical protein